MSLAMQRLAMLFMVVTAAACQSGGGSDGRMATKVSEIERTVQVGSTTTIDKSTVHYEGSKILQISQFRNGMANGVAKPMYGGAGIEKIEYLDKEGDKALQQLTYADGRVTKGRYEVTGVMINEDTISYLPDRKDLVKEIASTRMPTGAPVSTTLVKYEYDAEGRATKATNIVGTATSSTEYRYDTKGQLDRMTTFSGASVVETYTFSYTAEGTLDEVVDSKNNRYELTYDQDGRIVEVRLITTGSITTTRYTYAAGNANGWTFAPAVPGGGFFDIGGNPYTNISMLHGTIEVGADIPKPVGNPGGVCPGFTPQDACDTCLASSCCTQTKNCLQGTACYSFYECAKPCTTQSCIDSCRSANPSGGSAYDALGSCAQSFCSSQCQQ